MMEPVLPQPQPNQMPAASKPEAAPVQPITPKPIASEQPVSPNPLPPEPPKKGHKKLIFVIFMIFLLLIVGFIGLILLSSKNQSKKPIASIPKTTPTPEPKLIQADILEAKNVLSEFQKELATNSPLTQGSSSWELKNGETNNLTGYSFSLGDKYIYKPIAKLQDENGNTFMDPEALLSVIDELTEISDDFFVSKGFKLNKLNSQKSTNLAISTIDGKLENGFSITNAYEKDGIYCFANLNQTIETYGLFYCGVTDAAENQLQNTIGMEIQRDLNTTNDPDAVYRVENVTGNFASGGFGAKNGPGGGGFWAKKTDGKWVAIYATQNGGLPCDIALENNAPSQWIDTCEEATPTPTPEKEK